MRPRSRGSITAATLASLLGSAPLAAHGPKIDVRTHLPSAQLQTETSVVSLRQCLAGGAAEPNEIVLVAHNDSLAGLAVERSVDGGKTFAATIVPGFAKISDPVLAVGPPVFSPVPPPCGNPGDPAPPPPPVHLAFVFPIGPVQNKQFHVGVSTSTDGGVTWDAPLDVSPGLPNVQDKPWIDVDMETGLHYVCWTDANGAGRILVSGGAYAKTSVGGDDVGGCQIAVDTVNDQLHVVWFENPGPQGVPSMMFTTCPLAGPPCATPTVIDRHVVHSGVVLLGPDGKPDPVCLDIALPDGPVEAWRPEPSLTAGGVVPGGGPLLLVVWDDRRFGTPDILLRRSTSLGASWGAGVRRVNKVATRDQFQPTVFARQSAKLHWYDRHEDPANLEIRLWGALSKNGGLSWKNQPISDETFEPRTPLALGRKSDRPCYIGDYNGLYLDAIQEGSHFLHAWGDHRDGDPDVYFDIQDSFTPGMPDDPDDPPPGVLLLPQAPSFSIAAGSPSAIGASPFHPADVLRRVAGSPPAVGIACASLGLTADGCDDGTDGDLDDLVGLSYGDDFAPLPDQPLVAFSVAPGAAGLPGTAVAAQASCDAAEPEPDEFAAPIDGFNLQVFDGDGAACAVFGAPGLGLQEDLASPPANDDLDAVHGRDTTEVAPGGVPAAPVYFTLAAGSPSLAGLGFSTAHILKTVGGSAPTVFAAPADLGLVAGDQLSDFCLREDGDGVADGHDLLFFSLAPGSPTLATIGADAATVLRPAWPALPPAAPVAIYTPADLGLAAGDVLDALKCELPLMLDGELVGSAPALLTGTVDGDPLTPAIELDLSNQGPSDGRLDTWLWVRPGPGTAANWTAAPDDECIGSPLAFNGAPDPRTDCSSQVVRGLHFAHDLGGEATAAPARTLRIHCLEPGSRTVTVFGGTRFTDPPGAADLFPSNDFFTQTIALDCAAAPACPGAPGLCYHSLRPCRLLDTRLLGGGGPLQHGDSRAVALTGGCAVPATAVAVALNLTVVAPTAAGHLTAYPANEPSPPTSTLNFAAGQTRANNAVLAVGPAGAPAFRIDAVVPPDGQTHVIVDVAGYFQ